MFLTYIVRLPNECNRIYNVYISILMENDMPEQSDWEKRAANLLKGELKRNGVTYASLVERLADNGIREKEINIANKLSRGKFSAVFMMQCLEAIGVTELRL